MKAKRLAVIETHPIQYHAPVYRTLEQEYDISVTSVYGSDFSLAGHHDAEFGADFAWDVDLVSGYDARFLSRVAQGGAQSEHKVTTRGLAAQLRAVRPGAVMLVGYSPRFHRDAFITAWRGSYPLLFRGETTDHAVTRSAWKGRARSLALAQFYARFAALLYVGKRSREHFERLGVASSRLFFSPYCVDTTPFQLDPAAHERLRAETRAAHGIAPEDKVILFVGKLSPRKAPELLLNALRQLPDTLRAQTTLLFVGDGELRESLVALAQQSPPVRIILAGFQNQTHLSRFYHAADVLALSSRAGETWGLVVNEALHHGVPCIVSDRVGCAPDLIIPGETGEIFRADDAADLSRALAQVLGWSGPAQTQAACRARAELYSTRRAAEGIAQAFEAVARKK